MPEGPSIIIAKEDILAFKGKKVLKVAGNSKIDKERLTGQTIVDVKSWGKHLLICFKGFTLRIHFLMFGKYTINENRSTPLMLSLQCKKDTLNFYTCAIRMIDEPLNEVYEWSADVMNGSWSPLKARKKLKADPSMSVCDALLDQQIFSGVGNIIKNEVLYRIRVHPMSVVGKLPPKQLAALIRETRNYSFEFLEWKKAFVLKKHWLIYTKKTCPRDHIKTEKQYLGKTKRRTFFCNQCQILYK